MNRGNAGKGRIKGSTNKVPTALKEMILQALADVGGVEYLKAQALNNATPFLALVGRVLPMQVKEGGDDPTVPHTTVTHKHLP